MFLAQIEKKLERSQEVHNHVHSAETKVCGVEIPLDVHAALMAESKRRKVAFKKVVLEHILAEHKRRQMR